MQRILTALALCLPVAAWAAGPMYVQSTQAKLLDQPRFSGKTVSEVKKGQALEVLTVKGRWVKVRFHDKAGWVSRFLLSNRQPIKKVTVLKADGEAVAPNARRRASAVTTAGAARGLAAEDRVRASSDEMANYSALAKLETVHTDPKAVATFLAEGLKQ